MNIFSYNKVPTVKRISGKSSGHFGNCGDELVNTSDAYDSQGRWTNLIV